MTKRIIILFLALLICVTAYAVLTNLFPLKYQELINEKCDRYGFPRDLVYAQIFKESKFETEAVSKKGAVGLMQIMPETGKWCAEKMGISSYNHDMLKNPEISLEIGLWYLNYLNERTNDLDFALAAYNGGIANAQKWLEQGILPEQIPFPETNDYVRKINDYRKIYRFLYWRDMK